MTTRLATPPSLIGAGITPYCHHWRHRVREFPRSASPPHRHSINPNLRRLHTIPNYPLLNPHLQSAGGPTTYLDKILALNPIAYWPVNEATGTIAIDQINSPDQDGTHVGVTLGQTGIGDGETCPLYDGVNDCTNINKETFRNAFNGSEGTLLLWAKVYNVGVWTDGAGARTAIGIAYDAGTHRMKIEKAVANNQLIWAYEAGNVYKEVAQGGYTDIDWMTLALTYSATADEMKAYKDGAQVGSTQTGLGTWSQVPDVARCCIGDRARTHVDPWHGYCAHCAVFDTALTPADIASLATL